MLNILFFFFFLNLNFIVPAMLYYVTLCYVTFRYVILCYATLHYLMLICYASFRNIYTLKTNLNNLRTVIFIMLHVPILEF